MQTSLEEITSKNHKDKIGIFYGSQSGSTAKLAKIIDKTFESHHLKHTVKDLYEFTPFDIEEVSIIIILISTFYEGQPPDSAVRFFSWLSRLRETRGFKPKDQSNAQITTIDGGVAWEENATKLGENICDISESSYENDKIFENKFFSIFSLGDITFNHFNSVGMRVDEYLEDLGGRRMMDVCISSSHDSDKLNSIFSTWTNGLLSKIKFLESVGYRFESFNDLKSNKRIFKVEKIKKNEVDQEVYMTLKSCKFGIDLENVDTYKELDTKDEKYDAHIKEYLSFQDMEIVNVEELRDQNLTDKQTKLFTIKGINRPFMTGGNIQMYP